MINVGFLKDWTACLKKGELSPKLYNRSARQIINYAIMLENATRGHPIQKRITKLRKEAEKIENLGEGRRSARLKTRKRVECPVCYTKNKLADSLRLNCDHQFCKKCLIRNLQNSKLCPCCRRQIDRVEGDHIYKLKWEGDKMVVKMMA